MGPACAGDDNYDCRCYFFAAARSTKVLPPFILCDNGASLIWITTASASTPRFFTSAWVMSRIMPAFCSSVRPAAMLTVISGIVVSPFALAASLSPHTQFSSLHNGFAVIAGGAAARPRLEGWPIVLMVRDGASAPPHHEVLIPLHVMAGEGLLFLIDQVAPVDDVLGLGLFFQIFLAIPDLGQAGTQDQILDLDFPVGLLVRALNDRAGRVAAVGVFHLLAEAVLGIAKIKLGANAGVAQHRNHLLVARDLAAEYGDHDRPERRLGVEIAEHGQRSLQPRHPDRKSGRRHRLASKARDQPVISSAAADRTEANRAAFFVLGFEREFYFVDRAGIVLQAAHDGRIDANAIRAVAGRGDQLGDLFELAHAGLADFAFAQISVCRSDRVFPVIAFFRDRQN